MKAKVAVVATESVKEKNINLRFPILFERVLIGTRVKREIMEGSAMIRPSWTVFAPTSTMYKGRNGPVTANPNTKRKETTTTPNSSLDPANICIAEWTYP